MPNGSSLTNLLAQMGQRTGLLVSGVAILSGAVLVLLWIRSEPAAGSVTAGADVIAVLPFSTSGGGLDLLGEGMVDLVSTNLDQVPGIRTIPPRTVLAAWHALARGDRSGLGDALEVGRHVGASSVLVGRVVAVGRSTRIEAELHDAEGAVIARVRVQGPSEDLLALADSLSREVLGDVWRSRDPLPPLRVAAVTTTKLDALRAYLLGMRGFREGRFDAAELALKRAIERDSTFALAHYQLSRVLGWSHGPRTTEGEALLRRADGLASRLPVRTRRLVRAFRITGESPSQGLDSLRVLALAFPDDPAVLFELADALFHEGVFGTGDSVLALFDRTAQLDPELSLAYSHPAVIALRRGDSRLYQRYTTGLSSGDPRYFEAMRAVSEALFDGEGTLKEALELLVAPADWRSSIVGPIIGYPFQLVDADPSDHLALIETFGIQRIRDVRLRFLVAGAWSAQGNLRRRDRVLAEGTRNREWSVQTEAETRARVELLAALAGYGGLSADARNRLGSARPPPVVDLQLLDVLEQVRSKAPTGARLAEEGLTRSRGSRFNRTAFQALRAWAHVEAGDTVGGLAAMKEAVSGVWGGDGASRMAFRDVVNLQYAALLSRRSDSGAEGLLLLRRMLVSNPHTQTLRLLELGRALEHAGRFGEAIRHYDRFAYLLRNAAPGLPIHAQIVEARTAAVRLRARGPG